MQAILHSFADLEAAYADYKERANPLHQYMQRQWSFVAGIAEPFYEMKWVET